MKKYAYTPRGYAAQVALYAYDDPRRKIAAARAALATQAARAAMANDYATARNALRGLDRLMGLGTVDAARLSRTITDNLRTASGRLNPDARDLATGRRVAGIVGAVAGIITPVMSLISGAITDPGLRRAWNWVQLTLTSSVAPTFGEDDLRLMAGACTVWNSSVRTAVIGAVAGVRLVLTAATIEADAGTAGDVNLAMTVLESLVSWVTQALDTICTSLVAVYPPASAIPSCAGAGVLPGTGAVLPGAEGCCPDLMFDLVDGRCKFPNTTTPDHAAMVRWQTAWNSRRNVEIALVNPLSTPLARADAEARDQSTSAALCAAERALLVYRDPIPARGAIPSQALLDNARRNPNAFTLAAVYFSAPSANPRCYVMRPPTGGCPSGCSAGAGGGGKGAGIVALALPAAAILWYMSKK